MTAVPSKNYPDLPFGHFAPGPLMSALIRFTSARSGGRVARLAAFLMRRIGVLLLRGRPLDVTALGARARLFPYNNTCEKRILFTPQYFDPRERAALLARVTADFVFVDIGANIGGYSLAVRAHAGPRLRILAVEPQPEIFARLAYNFAQNTAQGGARLSAVRCAVTGQDGEVELTIDTNNSGESSLRPDARKAAGKTIKVEGKTLLTLLGEFGAAHVDAMKLDVEGVEDIILTAFFRDAPESLWPKFLILEFSPALWGVDLPAVLAARGYAQILDTGGNRGFERGKG